MENRSLQSLKAELAEVLSQMRTLLQESRATRNPDSERTRRLAELALEKEVLEAIIKQKAEDSTQLSSSSAPLQDPTSKSFKKVMMIKGAPEFNGTTAKFNRN
jgi:hypothetical protein